VEVKMEDVGGYTVHVDSSEKGDGPSHSRTGKKSVDFVKELE